MLTFAQSCCRSKLISIPRIAVLVAIFIIILVFPFRTEIKSTLDSTETLSKWLPIASSPAKNEDVDLATELISILEEYSPAASKEIEAVKDAKVDLWPAAHDAELMDILETSPEQILNMMENHIGFIKAVGKRLPRYEPKHNLKHSQGIVTVGGGSYFPAMMVSLRLLRRAGTSLPVEVFVPEQEYEAQLCEEVLPTLNAACRTFPENGGKISHYQYKVFAIILSSFDDVLWLDADNFSLHNSASLFTSKPFRETGMVTWPDIWQTSISPAYYIIAGTKPTPVPARASTESGQLLVSKSKHWRTLLLAAYYNYYGPVYYYTLLCQGGAGCGDKETFLPAAEAMGLPFYAVEAQPQPIGHYKHSIHPERGIYRFALIQGDPSEDFVVTTGTDTSRAVGTTLDGSKTGLQAGGVKERDEEDAQSYDSVRPFFLHMMTPKWDAYHVFDHVGRYDLTLDYKHQQAPAYQDPPNISARIKGVERMVWEETKWVACNLEEVIGYWEGKRGAICEKLEKYFSDVLDTEKGIELGLAASMVPAPYIP
ncbi:mannosyltransferase [Diaporthe australafricana]|uniref:Mannosyltransferase n=1 Tax=Diaporthe australafricana TaxID=127596 RepID=A0ABR3XZ01_9PEZI